MSVTHSPYSIELPLSSSAHALLKWKTASGRTITRPATVQEQELINTIAAMERQIPELQREAMRSGYQVGYEDCKQGRKCNPSECAPIPNAEGE